MTEPDDTTTPTTTPTGVGTAPAPPTSALVASIQEQIDDFTSRGQLAHLAVARHFKLETQRVNTDIDTQNRRVAGLKAEAAEADRQVEEYTDGRPEMVAGIAAKRAEIAKADAAGDKAGAAEMREDLRVMNGNLVAWDNEVEVSRPEAARLHAELTTAETALAEARSNNTELIARSRAAEDAADVLDDKAAILTEAVGHAKEVDRLDLEAHRFRNEGRDVEADQIKAASDEHARLGIDKINEAGALTVDDAALDAIPGAGRGSTDPNLLDPDPIDGTLRPPLVAPTPPMDPAAHATPPDGANDPATPVGGTADPNEMEMDPVDVSRPEASMPATEPLSDPAVFEMEPLDVSHPDPEAPAPVEPAPNVIDMEPELIEVPRPPTPPTTPADPAPVSVDPRSPTQTVAAAPAPAPAPATPVAPMVTTPPADGHHSREGELLSDRADAIRASLTKHFASEIERIGLARDDAARTAYSSEQEAKSADMQVKAQAKAVTKIQTDLTQSRADLASAQDDHDGLRTVEIQEDIAVHQAKLHAATVRLDHAAEEGTKLRVEAAANKAAVTELEAEDTALRDRSARAEDTLDAMENKAMLQGQMEGAIDQRFEFEAKAEQLQAEGKPTEAAAARKEASEWAAIAHERGEEAEQIQFNDKTLDFVPRPAVATPDPLAAAPPMWTTDGTVSAAVAPAGPAALMDDPINPADPVAVSPAMAFDPTWQSDAGGLATAVVVGSSDVVSGDDVESVGAEKVSDALGQDDVVADRGIDASAAADVLAVDGADSSTDPLVDSTTDLDLDLDLDPDLDLGLDRDLATAATDGDGFDSGVDDGVVGQSDGFQPVAMNDLSASSFDSDVSTAADDTFNAPAEDDGFSDRAE